MEFDINGPHLYQERSKEIFDYDLDSELDGDISTYRERYAEHFLES